VRSKRSPRPLPRGAPKFAGIAVLGAGVKPPPPPICGGQGSGLRGALRGQREEEEQEQEQEEEEDAEGERGVWARGHTHGRAASHIASQLQETRKGHQQGPARRGHRGPTPRPLEGTL